MSLQPGCTEGYNCNVLHNNLKLHLLRECEGRGRVGGRGGGGERQGVGGGEREGVCTHLSTHCACEPGINALFLSRKRGLHLLHTDVEGGASVDHMTLVCCHLHTACLTAVVRPGARERGRKGGRSDSESLKIIFIMHLIPYTHLKQYLCRNSPSEISFRP